MAANLFVFAFLSAQLIPSSEATTLNQTVSSITLLTREPVECVFASFDPYIFMLCGNGSQVYTTADARTACSLVGQYEIAHLLYENVSSVAYKKYFGCLT
jgi:hypothetical protein